MLFGGCHSLFITDYSTIRRINVSGKVTFPFPQFTPVSIMVLALVSHGLPHGLMRQEVTSTHNNLLCGSPWTSNFSSSLPLACTSS